MKYSCNVVGVIDIKDDSDVSRYCTHCLLESDTCCILLECTGDLKDKYVELHSLLAEKIRTTLNNGSLTERAREIKELRKQIRGNK